MNQALALPELQKLLVADAWKIGSLAYKLKPAQKLMRQAVYACPQFRYVIKCSRRLGKSFFLCSIATETALRKPYAQIRYGAPTNKDLRKIIRPIMRKIIEDSPEPLRPRWIGSEQMYEWPNGSQMHLAGLNKDPDALRGPASDLFIIDEAGTVNDLEYIITDIALPQFLDVDGKIVQGRRLLISGTPARTPAHEFTEISRVAEKDGNYSHFTIHAGGYPEETVEIFKREAGGEESSTWKREYLAMDVIDEETALVPEWKEQYEQEFELDDLFRFYLKYESLDIGVRDLTVCLFAHYDFRKATLFLHDEFAVNGPRMTTKVVAEGIHEVERLRFFDHEKGELFKVNKRISDIDLLLVNDLRHLHKLPFQTTDKGKLEEMLNEVRIWVKDGRIVVHPRCKQLIGCLRYGVWNEKRTEFDRSKAYGHFDALAALMYLVRNVDVRYNPIPVHYGRPEADYFWTKPEEDRREKFKKAFGVRDNVRLSKISRKPGGLHGIKRK